MSHHTSSRSLLITGTRCNALIRASLRKDQHAVGTNGKRGVAGEAVVRARCGDHSGARMPCEVVAVPLPIAVETECPGPCGREADDVALLRLVEEVGHDHDVIPRSTLVPTAVGEDLACVVHVIDLRELTAEAARAAIAVEPQ